MIQKIGIKNYKSIVEDEIELGRINVFIGENGAGKSNILEGVAMYSAYMNTDLSAEGLFNRGVRITKPNLMCCSFPNSKNKGTIDLFISNNIKHSFEIKLMPEETENIYSKWVEKNTPIPNNLNNTKLVELFDFVKSNLGELNIPKEGKAIIDYLIRFTDNNWPSVMDYQIYNLSTLALRGINQNSKRQPLGINGEGLDVLISTFTKEEMNLLKEYSYFISWLKDVIIDEKDLLKFQGHKLNRSISRLYFKDQYMKRTNNIFAAENANEGALYVLFYLALFISKKTPGFFAIDNIETALNPKLCRELMKSIAALSKKTDKQALITTHNPAILDGINLNDDEQRLFVVSRTDEGHTKTRRIKLKPKTGKLKYKLSELWMNGDLGGIPNNFL